MYCMCEKYGGACACDVKSSFQRVLCAIKNPVADNKPARTHDIFEYAFKCFSL